MSDSPSVSVIIPAHNAAGRIAAVVQGVLAQRPAAALLDVIVVDDGSSDATAALAQAAGARVLRLPARPEGGNPAAARNRGARAASGEFLVFLDADCTVAPGWLDALLAAHRQGALCVGGALALPRGLSASARWDYYCGWYHVHPRRAAGPVPNHPPCNLSVRRDAFLATDGFTERQPVAYAHEELAWQAALQRSGHPIVFEPRAVAYHWNRPGLGNLLRRNYRWAYSAVESKATTRAARAPWLYRRPWVAMAAGALLAPAQAAYITGCWLRAGVLEPLAAFPVVLAARLAYAAGMVTGGLRWLRHQGGARAEARPRWE